MKTFLATVAVVAMTATSAFGQVYNNPTDLVVPDGSAGAAVSSNITVSGFVGNITDVNLCVAISQTYDGDMNFVLEGPNGVVRHISSGNGGSGDNYGNGSTGTYFDVQAATAITAGSAPFAGRYRPETTAQTMIAPAPAATAGDLSSYNGISANGTWRLWLRDTAAGDVGTLRHWSLIFNDTGSPGTITDPACNLAAPPPPATDLGSIAPTNGYITHKDPLVAGGINWYKFTTTGAISSPNWLIGETLGSMLTGGTTANDTEIALFDSTGTLLVSNDDIAFPANPESRIWVGATPPAQTPAGGTAGPASLAAGTYYVAVGGYNSAFASGFSASSTSLETGSLVVTLRTPEPATMALLVFGSLALVRRRR